MADDPQAEDANVATIRASQLLYRVLTQCSARLGFASLSPTPLTAQLESSRAPIPALFAAWAASE